jgi:hypothetical protein
MYQSLLFFLHCPVKHQADVKNKKAAFLMLGEVCVPF